MDIVVDDLDPVITLGVCRALDVQQLGVGVHHFERVRGPAVNDLAPAEGELGLLDPGRAIRQVERALTDAHPAQAEERKGPQLARLVPFLVDEAA